MRQYRTEKHGDLKGLEVEVRGMIETRMPQSET